MCRHGHFHLVDPKAAHCTSDDAPAFSITHYAYLWSHFFHSFRVLLFFYPCICFILKAFLLVAFLNVLCSFILCLFLFYCFFWCFARVFFLSLSSLLAMNVSARDKTNPEVTQLNRGMIHESPPPRFPQIPDST